MKKRIMFFLLAFAMIIPCAFGLVACKEDVAKPVSITVELSNNDYSMSNNTIEIPYGEKVELSDSDFTISLVFDDEETKVISIKTEKKKGYTFTSTIPNDNVTPLGDYSITFSYKELEDVVITVKVVKATVNMDSVDWTYVGPYVYDGEEKEISITGLPNGVSVTYEGVTKATNAGIYEVTAHFSYVDENNYNPIDSMTLTWEIEKAMINVSNIEMTNYVYDGLEKEAEIKNIVLPDNVVVDKIEGETLETDFGSYVATIYFKYVGNGANNYFIPSVSKIWEIEQAIYVASGEVLVVLDQNDNYVYNGLEHSVTFDYSDFDTENVIVSGIIGDVGTSAGKYDVVIELDYIGDNNNYKGAENIIIQDAWEIEKAPLTVNVNNHEVTYGDAAANSEFEVQGLVNGELKENVLKGAATYNYVNFEEYNGKVGSYSIEVSGLSADNYDIFYNPGTLVVKQATVGSFEDVALKVDELTYNGNDQTIAEVLSDFDGVPAGVKISSIEGNTSKNANLMGNTLVVKFVVDDSGNYKEFTEVTKELTWKIIPKALTVTAKDNTITYGDAPQNNGFEVDAEGLVGIDTEAVVVGDAEYSYGEYVQGESGVGTYDIIVSGLFAANYTLNFVKGTLTVLQKEIDISTLTWESVENLVYNGQSIKPELATVSGISEFINVTYSYTLNSQETDAIDVGEYVAKVVLVEPVNQNIKVVGELVLNEIEYTVNPAIAQVETLTWEDVSNLVYDEEAKYPELLDTPEYIIVVGYIYYEKGDGTKLNVVPINVGEYVAEASLVSTNSNYQLSQATVTLEFEIKQAEIDASTFTWQYLKKFEYTGSNIGPVLVDVPYFISVTYNYQTDQTNAFTNVGDYTATVALEVNDNNYKVVNQAPTCEYSIIKTKATLQNVKWNLIFGTPNIYSEDRISFNSQRLKKETGGYDISLINVEIFDVLYDVSDDQGYNKTSIPTITDVNNYYFSAQLTLKDEHKANYYIDNDEEKLYVDLYLSIIEENPFKTLQLNGSNINYTYLLDLDNLLYGDVLTFEANDGYRICNYEDQDITQYVAGTDSGFKISGPNVDNTFNFSIAYVNEVTVNNETINYPNCQYINVYLGEGQDNIYMNIGKIAQGYYLYAVNYDTEHFVKFTAQLIDNTSGLNFACQPEEELVIYASTNANLTELVGDEIEVLNISVYAAEVVKTINFNCLDANQNEVTFDIDDLYYGGMLTDHILLGVEALDVNDCPLRSEIYLDYNLTQEANLYDLASLSKNGVYIAIYDENDEIIKTVHAPVYFRYSVLLNYGSNIDMYNTIELSDDIIFNIGSANDFSITYPNLTGITQTFNGEETIALNGAINKFTYRVEYSLTINEVPVTYYFEKELTINKSEVANNFAQDGNAYLEDTDTNITYNITWDNTLELRDEYGCLLSVTDAKEIIDNIESFKFATISSKEVVEQKLLNIDGDYYLEIKLQDKALPATFVAAANEEPNYYYIYIKIIFDGSLDNNTNISGIVSNVMTKQNSEIQITDKSFTISNPALEEIDIYLDNEQATAVIEDKDGQVVVASEDGSINYMFRVAGTYSLIVTATNGYKETYTIIVDEILPILEIKVENGEDDLTFVQSIDEDGRLVGDFESDRQGTYFNAYIEDVETVPETITMLEAKSAIFKSLICTLYLDEALTQEITELNNVTLAVNKDADVPYAAIYVKYLTGPSSYGVIPVKFIIGEKPLGELVFSIQEGDNELKEYFTAEGEPVGDFHIDMEVGAYVGFLGLGLYDDSSIVIDKIALKMLGIMGGATVYDYVAFMYAMETEDYASLVDLSTLLNANYEAENLELQVLNSAGIAMVGFVLVTTNMEVFMINIYLCNENEKMFDVSANNKTLSVYNEFVPELLTVIISGDVQYSIFDDNEESYALIYGYLGEVSSDNIEVIDAETTYLKGISLSGNDLLIADANDAENVIEDLSNFKLKIAYDEERECNYVSFMIEGIGYMYLYFDEYVYPAKLKFDGTDLEFDFQTDLNLNDFGSFKYDFDQYYLYTYLKAEDITLLDVDVTESDGLQYLMATLNLKNHFDDYSYMVMLYEAYDYWASSEISDEVLEELLSQGGALKLSSDVNDKTIEDIMIIFKDGIGYIDVAIEGFDGHNDGELDLIRLYFIIEDVGNRDDIEYGLDSEENISGGNGDGGITSIYAEPAINITITSNGYIFTNDTSVVEENVIYLTWNENDKSYYAYFPEIVEYPSYTHETIVDTVVTQDTGGEYLSVTLKDGQENVLDFSTPQTVTCYGFGTNDSAAELRVYGSYDNSFRVYLAFNR